MIGISVYPGQSEYMIKDTLEYIKECNKIGIKNVFTSLHIPESTEKIKEEFAEIMKLCHSLDMRLSIDIADDILFDIKNSEKINAVRIDYGLSTQEIIELYNELSCKIELNGSIIDENVIIELINGGIKKSDIEIFYNFYPKKYTGMNLFKLYEKNKLFKQFDLICKAFIGAETNKRGPLFDGLPTVEEHRNIDSLISYQELKLIGIDVVYFGDGNTSIYEIKKLTKLDENVIYLPVEIYDSTSESEIQHLMKEHELRVDSSDFLFRSSKRLSGNVIMPNNTVNADRMSITIDNINYKRYQGEVGITLKDIDRDERVNVIGKVVNAENIFKLIEGKPQKIKFVVK